MRVIAGRLGGRRLTAPHGAATRPTTDRVREALFSALGDVGGRRVCDLYAGTGALGIEALSRGAARAVFVESGRPALTALRQNLSALGLDAEALVIPLPAERAFTRLADEAPFDLVLLDPPWADLASAADVAARLARQGLLAPDSRLVLEHARRDPPPPLDLLTLDATRIYGDTAVSLYTRP
ncbi:16S rRNA (guanine(966)-N(2))-methyltransferase RsmD [Chondromyces apiculatus]|uniref:Putative methyltransferase n=1 Tax=Chondromyces apiculatus DSM 436 TaxID=1192034 RepID=A0A017TD26_9BACT|nr:16S rRNA (guanine(966)-N(2))-methyltransferase RsmD [Chondromyces apiculatus]EYF06720.1 putative methyltransferase [Chondromyces apiculatus DSM 436]